jgi:hypothetical protein
MTVTAFSCPCGIGGEKSLLIRREGPAWTVL